MSTDSAREILRMIAQHWNIRIDDERYARIWLDYLERQDDVALVMDAIARLAARQPQRPTVSDLRFELDKIRVEQRAKQRPAEPEDEGRFSRDLPGWVKGWMVARYAERDMRVWPEQGHGYDEMQREYPHTRTYVWAEQEPMPPEERAGYEQRGSHITAEKVGAIFAGTLGG